MTLSGKQRRYLRALGHHLSPVVLIGKGGVDSGVAAATAQALHTHELVKVKLPEELGKREREAMARSLAARVGAELAQVIGRTALLYKARKQNPGLVLPGLPAPVVGEVHTPQGPAPHQKKPRKRRPRGERPKRWWYEEQDEKKTRKPRRR